MLKANSVILFQGDSVTDVGWRDGINNSLGEGYPFFVSEELKKNHAELNITVINRGISGNRSSDLVSRWDKDCIEIKPDYLSILIGINDTWRRYDSNEPTSDEDYEKNLRILIERASKETDAQIILVTPFLLDTGDKSKMREDLIGKLAVVYRLADEYSLKLIDIDEYFTRCCKRGTKPDFISADGVHPTQDGHKLLSQAWLKEML